MKHIFKDFYKKTIFKVFLSVLIGVIAGTVSYNLTFGEEKNDFYKRVNFLVVGNDTFNQSSDAIFILSCDPLEDTIKVISVPSSTLVSLNGTKTTLSSIYWAGGAQILIDKITEIVPVPINNYIAMDFQAFRHIVDSLGGVDIEIPYDMNYYDSKVNYKIELKKGFQKLDGKKAEMFVRFIPTSPENQKNREDNQRIFFEEFIKQKADEKYILNFTDLFSEISPYITSDITLSDAENLFTVLEGLKTAEIQTESVFGKYEVQNNRRYFVADYEKNKNLLK